MRYYCTFFDRNYLAKGLALLRSLEQHESRAYRVYVVCLDELTRVILGKMRLPDAELIPLHEIEAGDEALGKARRTRERVEYYWTLTPSVLFKVMDSRPEIDALTYLDADLFFFSSPDPIHREFGDSSILIHEHRFSDPLKTLESNGKYNVGLLCFRRDTRGMTALKWWRDRCNEWCFRREENGKMGDQKYLDDWPTRFEGVHVLRHVGAGLGPWNHDRYTFSGSPPAGMVDGHAVVFYHFHALDFVAPQVVVPSKHAHYPVTEDVLRCCYLPYVCELSHAISRIRAVHPPFDFGLAGPIADNVVFMAHESVREKIDSAVPGYAHLDLDKEWRCYWPRNGRQVVRLSENAAIPCGDPISPGMVHEAQSTMGRRATPADYLSGDPGMLTEMWPQGRPVTSSDDLLKELSGRPITKEIRVLYVIGAHRFQERELLSRLFPNLEKIYLFEPLDGARQELQKLAQTDERLEVFRYAIADADGPIEFHITDNNGESSSILPMGKHREIFPWVHEAALVRVEGRTIDTVMREHHLRQPDMLFLDVQGAEYRILSSTTAGILSETRLIYSEVSKEEIYTGSRPLDDIVKLLSRHFLFAGFAPLMRISPTHGNALFINRKCAERLSQPVKPGAIEKKREGGSPLISAIVSTYDSDAFIAECLEDLTGQTIADRMEIIVIDAASPGDERAIVERFRKNHHNITYVRTGERIGVYAAWNLALRMAKGKYVTTFSTNDRLRRNAYEILAGALDDAPEVALVYGDSYLTKIPHETFDRHTRFGEFRWPEYSYDDLLAHCGVGPHPMWRKAIHEEIGYFDERYIALGDQEFWLRMGERHRLLHIREFTGLYWHSGEGLSNRLEIASPEEAEIRRKYRSRRRFLRGEEGSADRRNECSIVIPVFNKVEYTKPCIEAVSRHGGSVPGVELIVVDNGSTDGTAEYLRTLTGDVVIVRNAENLGFAVACNQGARVSRGRNIVFLNNDTVPHPGWLEALLAAAKEEDAAICGARLVYPDGRIQHAGVAFNAGGVGYHIFNGFPKDHPAVTKRRRHQAVTAACMLVRRDLFDELGGFDEGYRNGFEDVDFCLRAHGKGCRILYVPESVVVHHEETTEGRKAHDRWNLERFLARWKGKVETDDDRMYSEEGFRKTTGADGARIAIEPLEADDLASLGRSMKREKRYAEAIEAFRKARSGGDLSVLAEIGDCLAQEGKLEEATASYAEAIEANPRDAKALTGLGVLDLVMGAHAAAARRFGSVLETDGRNATALCGMGLARKAGEETGEALGWFARSLDADPVNLTALHELVKAAHELGRWKEAEGYLSAYLQYKPSDPHILFSLAVILFQSGKSDEAMDALDRLAFFDPSYVGADDLRDRISLRNQAV